MSCVLSRLKSESSSVYRTSLDSSLEVYMSTWRPATCLHKMFMYVSPGVRRTFPHIPICGSEFPGVEQEAGAVLLVALPGRPPPDGAPLVRAQHLVDGGAVFVSQSGRRGVTVLLGICREG